MVNPCDTTLMELRNRHIMNEAYTKKRSEKPLLFFVRETRVELARHCWHYLLRVARLPISPPALRMECKDTTFFIIQKMFFTFRRQRRSRSFAPTPPR